MPLIIAAPKERNHRDSSDLEKLSELSQAINKVVRTLQDSLSASLSASPQMEQVSLVDLKNPTSFPGTSVALLYDLDAPVSRNTHDETFPGQQDIISNSSALLVPTAEATTVMS